MRTAHGVRLICTLKMLKKISMRNTGPSKPTPLGIVSMAVILPSAGESNSDGSVGMLRDGSRKNESIHTNTANRSTSGNQSTRNDIAEQPQAG